jgi:hypothetical protein
MKIQKTFTIAVLFFTFAISVYAQGPSLIKRTTYKNDKLDFGAGGTLSIIGAPNGSIRIEGWSNREVEISAEIEIQAPTEADLDRLSKVTGYMTEESLGRTGIISIGTHDKKYLKGADKKFPKELMAMPYRVDFVIKVPRYCDLQVDGGIGDLMIVGVEGNMKINFLEANARMDLVGGGVLATIGKGNLELTIPTRSWRGAFADVQVASGNMVLNLPKGLNAEFDASILRTGKIDNGFAGFTPRSRKAEFTDRSIVAKAGSGSTPLKFTLGDGNMQIKEIGKGT